MVRCMDGYFRKLYSGQITNNFNKKKRKTSGGNCMRPPKKIHNNGGNRISLAGNGAFGNRLARVEKPTLLRESPVEHCFAIPFLQQPCVSMYVDWCMHKRCTLFCESTPNFGKKRPWNRSKKNHRYRIKWLYPPKA